MTQKLAAVCLLAAMALATLGLGGCAIGNTRDRMVDGAKYQFVCWAGAEQNDYYVIDTSTGAVFKKSVSSKPAEK